MSNALFIRRLLMNGRPRRTIFLFFTGYYGVANQALLILYKRYIRVIDRGMLVSILRFLWDGFKDSRFAYIVPNRSCSYQEFAIVDSQLNFTLAEEEHGRSRLRQMGIGMNDWYVCFHCRDFAYNVRNAPNRDWSYHDYRNSDIRNYIKAAHSISNRGGFAIRMGAAVETKLDGIDDPQIIDYASLYRDEFMDIYLSAKCKFFLGTSNGMAQVPLIFDRPIAYANCVPVWCLNFGKSSLAIPKLFCLLGESRLLTCAEMYQFGAYNMEARAGNDSSWYQERGIGVVENTADDILDLCNDMFDLLEGIPPPASAADLQREYKNRFFNDNPDRIYAPELGPRFALKYRGLITG